MILYSTELIACETVYWLTLLTFWLKIVCVTIAVYLALPWEESHQGIAPNYIKSESSKWKLSDFVTAFCPSEMHVCIVVGKHKNTSLECSQYNGHKLVGISLLFCVSERNKRKLIWSTKETIHWNKAAFIKLKLCAFECQSAKRNSNQSCKSRPIPFSELLNDRVVVVLSCAHLFCHGIVPWKSQKKFCHASCHGVRSTTDRLSIFCRYPVERASERKKSCLQICEKLLIPTDFKEPVHFAAISSEQQLMVISL